MKLESQVLSNAQSNLVNVMISCYGELYAERTFFKIFWLPYYIKLYKPFLLYKPFVITEFAIFLVRLYTL